MLAQTVFINYKNPLIDTESLIAVGYATLTSKGFYYSTQWIPYSQKFGREDSLGKLLYHP